MESVLSPCELASCFCRSKSELHSDEQRQSKNAEHKHKRKHIVKRTIKALLWCSCQLQCVKLILQIKHKVKRTIKALLWCSCQLQCEINSSNFCKANSKQILEKLVNQKLNQRLKLQSQVQYKYFLLVSVTKRQMNSSHLIIKLHPCSIFWITNFLLKGPFLCKPIHILYLKFSPLNLEDWWWNR